jgi:biotin carboxyl carrier protein
MLEVCACGRYYTAPILLPRAAPKPAAPVALPDSGEPLGETLWAVERLVISPAVGVFRPLEPPVEPGPIDVGAVLGTVSGHEVRSPFGGNLMGILVHPGERVQRGQRVAWLRLEDECSAA